MRLTLKPEGILESIAFKMGKVPRPFLLSMLGMSVSRVLFVAVRLNVFNHLQSSPKTVAEVANATDCDHHGMQILLESLDGFGFVQRIGDKYQLTKESAQWLTKSGGYIEDFMRLGGDIERQMTLLEQDVRTGEVPNFHFEPLSPTCWSNYLTMLKGSGRQGAPKLLEWAKLERAPQRLLDVGGGPGIYSITFCQRYPELKADVLDLPTAARAGKEMVAKAMLSSRINYIEGNLLEIEWGRDYDLILLCNILHTLSQKQCEVTWQKVFQALSPKGRVLIYDLYHPGTQNKLTPIVSLFSLTYFVTCGGRVWPQPTLLQWLTQTGFTNIRTHKDGLTVFVSAQKP